MIMLPNSPTPLCAIDVAAVVQSILRYPSNVSRSDRAHLKGLYEERESRGLTADRIQAIEDCIDEILDDYEDKK